MVRTVKSHHEDEYYDDEEFESRTPDASSQKEIEGRSGNQKVNALRSKHSETEQRRRSKINERFQILRDLIPQNDQKRDKASFLLEVIQYIHFLKEKLQMYEGSYQGWSTEPSKLMPWKNSCGQAEGFTDQSQLIKNGSGHEDNIIVTPPLLNAENSMESILNGAAVYKEINHPETQPTSLNMTNMFENVAAQPPQGSFSEAEHLGSESRSQFWQGTPYTPECSVPSYALNEQDEAKSEGGEASVSSLCSQGLLNTLTRALQSSGVDMLNTNISVRLDVGKQTNSGLTGAASFNTKEQENPGSGHPWYGCEEDSNPPLKKLRTDKS